MLDVLVDEGVHSAENTRKENTQMARDLSAFELLVLYLERDERRAILKKWQESLGRKKKYELDTGINYSVRMNKLLLHAGAGESQTSTGITYKNGYAISIEHAIKEGLMQALKAHHFSRRRISILLDEAFNQEWMGTIGEVTFETMSKITQRVTEICNQKSSLHFDR